jgi:cholesterol transport system auxiliary component
MNAFTPPFRTGIVVALTVLITGLSGCAGLTRPYPEKSMFAISAGDPPAASAAPVPAVLRVQSVRLAKPYDERTFVYRTGESAFTADYYNGFVAEPDRLLTGEVVGWLSRSGLFSAVVGGTSTVDYDLTLETNITTLCGDYSVKGSPKAVIEARCFLVREQGGVYTILFQKVYRESEPFSGDKPEQLVKGWGQALRRLLESLAVDLRAAAPPASRPVASGPASRQ